MTIAAAPSPRASLRPTPRLSVAARTPRAAAAGANDAPPHRPLGGAPVPSSRPGLAGSALCQRVLVVDGEPASTRLVRLTLERTGLFDVCEVNDPRCAVEAARRFLPHLILLDTGIPGLDGGGGGVAVRLRGERPLRNVPILFMSSLVTPGESGRQVDAAGGRVLAKPVTLSKLVQSVAGMLGNILSTGASAARPVAAV